MPVTDYYPLIARAISNLDRNTRATREQVYERARSACFGALKKREPSIPEAVIGHELGALEAAIRRVEIERNAMTAALVAKGIIGFVLAFVGAFAIEAMIIGGIDYILGRGLSSVGLGWIVMPLLSGVVGWRLFRKIKFAEAVESISMRVAGELGVPRSGPVLIVAIGAIAGVLLGFFISLTEGASAISYFPWGSLGCGVAGAIFALGATYVRKVLRPTLQQHLDIEIRRKKDVMQRSRHVTLLPRK
jgi:hypothetical protein